MEQLTMRWENLTLSEKEHMCLGLKAYKAHVGGVSSRCGIEQIREAKAKEHEPKRTIPANWGLRQETLPH